MTGPWGKLDLRWRFALAAGAVGGPVLALALALALASGGAAPGGGISLGLAAGLWAAGTAALVTCFYWIAARLLSIGEIAATREDASPAELRESVGAMLEEVERLSRLVEDLLLLTRRGDASGPEDGLLEVPLAALLEEVSQTYAVLAEEKRQSLELSCEPGLAVLARPEALGIAVANLLQNAIRHSPPGTAIRVTARASELAVTLEIADQGPGIPREHHAAVFTPFYRVDPSRSRASGGTGLGLAIAKRCAERCGGEIGLRSSPGSGSVFFLCLRKAVALS